MWQRRHAGGGNRRHHRSRPSGLMRELGVDGGGGGQGGGWAHRRVLGLNYALDGLEDGVGGDGGDVAIVLRGGAGAEEGGSCKS